tara:strand:- start:1005 stop:1976 length:972 start_codon:yes stop_codon:yes gene_type:complete
MIVAVIRGGVFARSYWDYKFLLVSFLPFTLLIFTVYIGNSFYSSLKLIRYLYKYILAILILLLPLLNIVNPLIFARVTSFVLLLLLCVPYLRKRYVAIIIIGVSLSILNEGFDFRMNIIRYVSVFLILLMFQFRKILFNNIWNTARSVILFLPAILILANLYGGKNIFQQVSDFNEDVVYTDTRTFLYAEVVNTVINTGNYIIGEGSTRGYDSRWFTDTGGAMDGVRYLTEVNILNIFLIMGLLGVFSYFLIIAYFSKLALMSNNYFIKMLGLNVALQWPFSFIENFSIVDTNFFFFWFSIGLISSIKIRQLSNNDLKNIFHV